MRISIVSWMGNDQETITKRLDAHAKQLEWFLSLGLPLQIHVLAQGYKGTWYTKHDQIHYQVLEQPKGLAAARNALLEDFYNSDDDWCILVDNDCVLYEYLDGKSIFAHMLKQKNKKAWEQIDIWYPFDPKFEPFKKKYEKDKALYDGCLIFKRSDLTNRGNFFAIKNPKISGMAKVYFVEDDQLLEGDEFILQAFSQECKIYKCMNTGLNELVKDRKFSTRETMKNIDLLREKTISSKKMLAELYGELGLTLKVTINGGHVFNGYQFVKKCFKGPAMVFLSKDVKKVKEPTKVGVPVKVEEQPMASVEPGVKKKRVKIEKGKRRRKL